MSKKKVKKLPVKKKWQKGSMKDLVDAVNQSAAKRERGAVDRKPHPSDVKEPETPLETKSTERPPQNRTKPPESTPIGYVPVSSDLLEAIASSDEPEFRRKAMEKVRLLKAFADDAKTRLETVNRQYLQATQSHDQEGSRLKKELELARDEIRDRDHSINGYSAQLRMALSRTKIELYPVNSYVILKRGDAPSIKVRVSSVHLSAGRVEYDLYWWENGTHKIARVPSDEIESEDLLPVPVWEWTGGNGDGKGR